MKQHRLAIFGLVAGLVGGGAAGVALGVPGFAGAQTSDPNSATSSSGPAAGSAPAPAPSPDRAAWMRNALAPLVANGTISQAQADAVVAALQAAKPARAKGPGHHGPRDKFGRNLDAAARAIGITTEELRTALSGGQSLADVARSKGVDPEAVVSALAGEFKTRLDQAVAAGRITQAQADEKLAATTERIRAMVNGETPLKGRPGRGPGGFPGSRPDPGAAPSSFRPATTNA